MILNAYWRVSAELHTAWVRLLVEVGLPSYGGTAAWQS